MRKNIALLLAVLASISCVHNAFAGNASEKGLYVRGSGTSTTEHIGERHYIVYTPHNLRTTNRPLLIVLHGGMGNAEQIQKYIGLEPYADKYGFVIAYMNGSAVTRLFSDRRAGWNAGECCGQSQANNVDDVGFINTAIRQMVAKYGIDPNRVYGTGHSNGGMMTYRMLCESDLYKGAVIYSGALELDVTQCPLARGKPILAIHGAKDKNLPVEGGYTQAGINRKTDYRSQEYTARVFKNSGANYSYILLPNAEHRPETINAGLLAKEEATLPQKIVIFLRLNQ